MEDFNKYLTDVKSLESSLWKYMASTSVIGVILVAGQWDTFDKLFHAVTELCVVIAGMAAILEAFLGSLHKASDSEYDVLNYQPLFLGLRAFAGLFFSALSYYIYYQYVTNNNELSLLFAMFGTYLFFRVIAQSVKHLNILERQSMMWARLSDEEKVIWFKRKKEVERIVDNMQKHIEISRQEYKLISLSVAESFRVIDELKKQKLKKRGGFGVFLAFIYPITKSTLNLRGSLGLVTNEERAYLKDVAEIKLELMKEYNS